MYIAARPIKVGKEVRKPGDLVPEAANWNPRIVKILIEQRKLRKTPPKGESKPIKSRPKKKDETEANIS